MSASLSQILEADGIAYDTVQAYGIELTIGSLCSEDIIEWMESNEDKDKRREAGLRMIVKSIGEVVRRDEQGHILEFKRLSKEEQLAALEKFRKKSALENGKVVNAALILNGLRGKAKELKNDSGEANPGASPIGLP